MPARATEPLPALEARSTDAGAPHLPEPALTVGDLMSHEAFAVHAESTLHDAARLMWEHDIGAVPVVDARGIVIGIVTDRDIAMSAFFSGDALSSIRVESAMSRDVAAVQPTLNVYRAAGVMRRHQVHRLPVVDEEGCLQAMLSLADIAQALGTQGADGLSELDVAYTLRAICVSRAHASHPVPDGVATIPL